MCWEDVFEELCNHITERQKKKRDDFKNIIFFRNYKESAREHCQYCNVYIFRGDKLTYQLCYNCFFKYDKIIRARQKKMGK